MDLLVKSQNVSYLKELSKFYIDSFNFVIDEGLKKACMDIYPVYTNTNPVVKISIADARMTSVQYAMDTRRNKNTIYPAEARMRGVTYFAEFPLMLKFEAKDFQVYKERTFFLPLMLKSNLCLLKDLTEEELIKSKEDINDPGGYFIIKGKERLIRQFIVPKRNYPLGLIDLKWKKDGYSEYGILVSSMKDNHSLADFNLHLVIPKGSGHPHFDARFHFNRKTYRISVMLLLKALYSETDYSLLQEIIKYRKKDDHYKNCICNMMTSLKLKQETKIVSQEQAKKYIGELCLPKLTGSPYSTHKEVADRVLRSSILIHLTKDEDKVQLLCFCMSKLYSIAFKECMADDIDNPCFQEILTPGQIYLMVVKEETENFLTSVKKMLTRKINEQGSNGITPDNMRLVLNYASSLTPEVQTVLSTGNFPGFKCGLKSDTGFTIPLKRTNIFEVGVQLAAITKFSMKFYSVNMRKFYPESWGFLCPAQTPEGENSGLHNYLAKDCKIVQALSKTIDLHMLYKIGLNSFSPTPFEDSYGTVVFADGLILGWVLDSYVSWFLEKLKTLRSESSDYVPAHTEIIYVPKFHEDSSVSPLLYHGIYILSSPWRLVRRILNSFTQKEELLGCLEQLTSVVSLEEDEGHKYSEIRNSNFLGFTASSIPFGEFNPGARNILSSSKMKQAVSFPFFNNRYRSDTKSTVLLHPQSPLVCTDEYAKHNWNDNPMGTNMCLCILSYSGFDMEDAVILNKASIQRGLVRDHVYKTTVYDLKDLADRFSLSGLDCITESDLEIKCDPNDPHISNYLDKDGMPYVGAIVVQGDPVLSVYSRRREQYLIETYDGIYKSYIESVRLLGGNPSLISNKKLPVEAKKVSITYRSQRIVEIGDKFNNRHSQKGICGYLMPPEDLPFSADGSVPDIIFNPHGIPSRSTIGMILEIISSKSAAAKGTKQIVVPFEFSDKRTPLEKFGPYLEKAGLHYNGTQKFYSGISGEELEADVFCGPVYYFRLTHVVQEKFQCGNVGEVDPVTQQPVNTGRSGAIRFGDMERDSILSHGTMDLTLDRLLHASDRCEAYLCENCLHLIPPVIPDQKIGVESLRRERKKCLLCNNSSTNLVQIPYVLVSLIVEMYAAGIRLSFPM